MNNAAAPESSMRGSVKPAKPRILLAASGSVAAIHFEIMCRSFSEWAEVRAVVTKSSLRFIDTTLLRDVILYTDEEEWSSWKKIGDDVLHIELGKWADVLVIAPLSANTLAKIAGGFCDDLLTYIVREWDFSKPLYVAPAMNAGMWNNPPTKCNIDTIVKFGISLIAGENGALAEPSIIDTTVCKKMMDRR